MSTPVATALPKVVLVQPESPSLGTGRLIVELRAEVERLKLPLTVLKARRRKTKSDWKRKQIDLLEPPDAERLYRALHHGPVLTTGVRAVFVLTNPQATSIREKDTVALKEFTEHKGCFVLVNGRSDVARLEPAFSEWNGCIRCEGRDDPRALPLHSFHAGGPCPELCTSDGRAGFAKAFGPARLRLDLDGRQWARAPELHGRDVLTVAGYRLQAGFHWHVGCRGGSAALLCANAVWHLPKRGYANVYPDGSVRGGSTDTPPIKKIWPR